LYLGYRHIAQSWTKTNRLLIANIATGLADHPARCQALIIDLESQVPNGVFIDVEEGLGAGGGTFSAERALSTPEIDLRVSHRAINDDAFWTGFNSLAAGSTAIQEIGLVNRPGRAHRCRA